MRKLPFDLEPNGLEVPCEFCDCFRIQYSLINKPNNSFLLLSINSCWNNAIFLFRWMVSPTFYEAWRITTRFWRWDKNGCHLRCWRALSETTISVSHFSIITPGHCSRPGMKVWINKGCICCKHSSNCDI